MKPVEQKTGKEYWRSLDELAETPEFRQFVEREFPEGASEMSSDVDRRKFIILMAAGIGMAGLTACRRPVEKVIPAAGKLTEQLIPGVPQYYATVYSFGSRSQGLLVRSNDGRPTKIEGNPLHPASLGATSGYAQASILDLYDPDRSTAPLNAGKAAKWEDFTKFATAHFADLKAKQGEGLRIIAESISSPALRELRDSVKTGFPQSKWVTFDALSNENELAGANIAFGQPVHVHYALDKADVILALDSDFLGLDPGSTANIKAFAKKRREAAAIEKAGEKHEGHAEGAAEHAVKMNRLYSVESNFSITGGMADHRLRMKSGQISTFLAEIARKLGVTVSGLDKLAGGSKSESPLAPKWVEAVSKDLNANKGRALIVVGARQPAHVHALANLVNAAIAGEAVRYTRAFDEKFESSLGSLKELVADMNGGKVSTLIVLGGNPVFAAPADLKLGEALKNVKTKIHLGAYKDETAAGCDWHINEAHYLETWGDGRAYDGTASIQQPLIAPLFNGKSAIELLAAVSGYPQQSGYDIVKNLWLKSLGSEKGWQKSVHDGVIAGTAFAETKPSANAGAVGAVLEAAPAAGGDFEVNFIQSSALYDGRFANNGWMQELPDPMTKLVWDNAALMSKDTADKLGVENENVVKVSFKGRELLLPVCILPGHAKNSISISVGYGRTSTGRIGNGVGSNAYLLRTSDAMDFGSGATVSKVSDKAKLALTHDHWSMENRPLVREATLAEFLKEPDFAKKPDEEVQPLDIYSHPVKYTEGNQWGMAIDLNTCVGCNACVIACQSENNIPIVGKDMVARGREMHWIRMDRYFTNVKPTKFAIGGAVAQEIEEDHMQAVQQPMACQQCENAPCEDVCPVAATIHNEEGLNTMAYNRCVGTRYCSNNCPFKVRRFNYLNWHKGITEVEEMKHNPEVTVRMRGVMEKCTYCTQRISAAKHQAKVEGHRPIKDGEIVPACAQVCPADAIVFGNINDPESQVAKLKKQERNYQLLLELNVSPRTSYLAKLRNENEELAKA